VLIDQDHNVAVSFATASMQIIDFHLPNRYNRTHIMLEVVSQSLGEIDVHKNI